jgi:nickel-type superoxide dismutase maturation protease
MVCELSHPTQSRGRARLRRLAVPFIVATLGLALRSTGRITRVVVSGNSMRPGLHPGDRLLVVPVLRIQEGQVVAVSDPRRPGRVLVKRVHSIRGGLVEVRGDNAQESTDSRHFGGLPRSSVIGRAVYRYAPAGRSGRLRA